tara:strand:- start:233 stop:445 length:213 start_codon:yes stop_codon:yes gene_type:complete
MRISQRIAAASDEFINAQEGTYNSILCNGVAVAAYTTPANKRLINSICLEHGVKRSSIDRIICPQLSRRS